MPKQTFKIEGFHGGINSNSDPRDISEIESPDLVDVAIDSVGRIKTLGTFTQQSYSNSLQILPNRGLFVMNSDKQLDGGDANETFIVLYDDSGNTFDIKDSEGWDTDQISLDTSHPVFYVGDGNLRIGDGSFTNDGRWFGHLSSDDEKFSGLYAASGTLQWIDESQPIKSPTVGNCLISTPFAGSDSDGVNSSSSEYIGNVADNSGDDVADLASVNLRVGLQYFQLLSNTASDTTPTGGTDGDTPSDYYPFVGNNNIKLSTNGSASQSILTGASQSYTITDENNFVIACYIKAVEWNDLQQVVVSHFTSGNAQFIDYAFSKEEIVPDCWNILVCTSSNNRSGDYSLGDTLVTWKITVQDGDSGSASPTFHISGPVLTNNPLLEGYQPGVYEFYHTYLYDEEKQESLPFKFTDTSTSAGIFNKVNVLGGSVLFNYDIYTNPFGTRVTGVSAASDTDLITKSSHGLATGTPIRLSGFSNVGGNNNFLYYVVNQSADTFKLANSYANAIASSPSVIDLSNSGQTDSSMSYETYSINRRITGSRIYYKVQQNDNYFLIGEVDFINNGFKWLPEGDTMAYSMANSSHASTASEVFTKNTSVIKGISPASANGIDTFRTINGFGASVGTIEAKFKTAVIHGRRCYIGNVKQGNKKHPDRIIKSQINKFDVFPDKLGTIDVAINDGENVIKLEAFADRILQFKEKTMYIINVSENVDFLEETFEGKGCSFDYHVTKTDYGVAWFNKFGVYFFDGKSVSNLLERQGIRLISESDWESFITSSDADMSEAHIGYIPKRRQLLIKRFHASLADVFIYDFVLKSWTKGSGKVTVATNVSNFAIDGNQELIYAGNTDSYIYTWDSSPQSTNNFVYQTKDIDFGQPGVRKKVYKVRISYKGDADNLVIKYGTSGANDFPYSFQGTDSSTGKANGSSATADKPLHDKADLTQWYHAELKPDNSTEANNIYSFQLQMSGVVDSDFELNDISIVYRSKSVN